MPFQVAKSFLGMRYLCTVGATRRLSYYPRLSAGLGTGDTGTGPCRAHELLAWVVADGVHGSDRVEAVSVGGQDSVHPPVVASEHERALG